MTLATEEPQGWRRTVHAVVALVWTIANVVFLGWVISQAWGWFVVPLRFPRLGVFHALGIRLLVYLLVSGAPDGGPPKPPALRSLALKTAGILFCWGIAYLLQDLMAVYPR
jgi:hypothetical protein